MQLQEYHIFQNKAIGAHILWEFTKQYYNISHKSVELILTMPIIPLCLNSRVVEGIKGRNFREGSLSRALTEHKDLFSGLQDRMENMATLTFESIYLASASGLIYVNPDSSTLTPSLRGLPSRLKKDLDHNKDYYEIISASKRLGAWFGQLNQAEILLYFNLRF